MSGRQQAQASHGRSASSASESSTRSQAVAAVLPHLRRYARAVTGSRESGDRYLRQFLGVVLSAPNVLTADDDMKLQCFTLFHQVCRGLDPAGDTVPAASVNWLERQLASLPPVSREVLLLVYLEGFPISQAARIVGIPEGEARDHRLEARSAFKNARQSSRFQGPHYGSVASLLALTPFTPPLMMDAGPSRQHDRLLDHHERFAAAEGRNGHARPAPGTPADRVIGAASRLRAVGTVMGAGAKQRGWPDAARE